MVDHFFDGAAKSNFKGSKQGEPVAGTGLFVLFE